MTKSSKENKIVKMAKLPRLEHALTLYKEDCEKWDKKQTPETCLVKSWSKRTVYCSGGFPLRLL